MKSLTGQSGLIALLVLVTDVPYDSKDPLSPFGRGLTYPAASPNAIPRPLPHKCRCQ